MKVAVIDYGMGNLASVCRAVETLGYQPFVASRSGELTGVSHAILPGVGAFGEAMDRMNVGGWPASLSKFVGVERGSLLGICLGMQMLATVGTEHGLHAGLGLIDGEVVRLQAFGVQDRIPHVGWNELVALRPDSLISGIPDRTDFYFVHSYALRPTRDEDLVAHVDYGAAVPAVVQRGRIWGCQFHPEKSSRAGLKVLNNFLSDVAC